MAGGRPTKYKSEYNKQVVKLCRLGSTDKELADFFEVEEKTINNWKKAEPEFLQSIKKGKQESDANIANALYHRAKGYSHKDVHISSYEGHITITPIVKHYAPDTAAAFIWLKNRKQAKWTDKVIQENIGELNVNVTRRIVSGPEP